MPVSAAEVRPLRRSVLRPGRDPEELFYPGDVDPDSRHLAVLSGGQIVGVATSCVTATRPSRGPATGGSGEWPSPRPFRGRGIGSSLLAACESHARRRGGSRLWCNARIAARNLYLDAGMVIEGEEFEIPGIGRHLLMSKTLA